MKSKSPFKQDKCTVAWEKWTAKYDDKAEAKREKGEFYYLKKPGGKKEVIMVK